jgi:hypothetical protein
MHMRICYLDCHEAGLCCYLVRHTENLLHPLQLFYFNLWPIYWLPHTYKECLNQQLSTDVWLRKFSSYPQNIFLPKYFFFYIFSSVNLLVSEIVFSLSKLSYHIWHYKSFGVKLRMNKPSERLLKDSVLVMGGRDMMKWTLIVCFQDRMLHFSWVLPTVVAIWLLAMKNPAYSWQKPLLHILYHTWMDWTIICW